MKKCVRGFLEMAICDGVHAGCGTSFVVGDGSDIIDGDGGGQGLVRREQMIKVRL
jgi:hypothetical protein